MDPGIKVSDSAWIDRIASEPSGGIQSGVGVVEGRRETDGVCDGIPVGVDPMIGLFAGVVTSGADGNKRPVRVQAITVMISKGMEMRTENPRMFMGRIRPPMVFALR